MKEIGLTIEEPFRCGSFDERYVSGQLHNLRKRCGTAVPTELRQYSTTDFLPHPLHPPSLCSILPLETICNTIETNVWELHRTHSTAAAEAQQEAQRGSWSQQAQQAEQGPQQVDADLLVGSLVSSWGGRRW